MRKPLLIAPLLICAMELCACASNSPQPAVPQACSSLAPAPASTKKRPAYGQKMRAFLFDSPTSATPTSEPLKP